MGVTIGKDRIEMVDHDGGVLSIDETCGELTMIVNGDFDYVLTRTELSALIATLNVFLSRCKD